MNNGDRHLGFQIEEEMSGTHHFKNGSGPQGEYPFIFRLTWGTDNLRDFVNPWDNTHFMKARAQGKVYIGEFSQGEDCEGTLELHYLEGKIRYTFTFSRNDKEYEFVGEKRNIRPWNLHRTHTTCYGVLRDKATGEEISESVTHFRLFTLPQFLRSFRLV